MRSLSWRHDILSIRLRTLPRGERLRVTLVYPHHGPRVFYVTKREARIRTGRPATVLLVMTKGTATSATITKKLRK